MDDQISRQAAVDALADMHCKSDEDGYVWIIRSDAWARIDALPAAQQEQRWVSSGKKPLKEGSYLVWMPFAPPKHRMAVAEYCGGYWNIKTPISAWMPLPEPYKEGQDEID